MNRSEELADQPGLSPQDKKALLRIARDAIQERALGRRAAPLPDVSPALREKRGVFVTLHKEGDLRGCIGYIQAIQPLFQAVEEMALSAAFGDPRFPPVRAEELPHVEVEISVLTPLRRVQDPSQIQVGQHGLFIVRGGFSGLLLPQVATECGWDRTTFLEHTCRKAGLPPDAWCDPRAEIYIFSAEIFNEKEG